ncbi:MAG: asparagine synthase (glutamine-hydrolyzing) [Thermogutta sp.]
MCGIAGGVWYEPTAAISAATLQRMTEVLQHRGPDDQGFYLKEIAANGRAPACGVALGHRRLSIIDLAGGHQPMSNEDETLWIVFNGEIYNFRALRQELEAAGHRFRSRSDTEVLLHLYEEKGLHFLEFVNGMFGLALWDEPKRRLILARDRLGEKPLVYYADSQRLLFASELKALMEVPGVPREIDPFAVDAYFLYQYVPHPWTIYRGIKKIPPATMAIYEPKNLTLHRYWDPDFSRVENGMALEEIKEELRSRLEKAVTMRLEADVPLGAFLSGGIDSTIVVGLMQKNSREKVRTFSIGFPVAEYDETHYARIAAEAFGTEHREHRVNPDAIGILPSLVWHYDEPFADSSAIPTWYVAEKTRQHVTVALTGDGGDELFCGYTRYWATAFAEGIASLPRWIRWIFNERLWRWAPRTRQRSFFGRVHRFTESLPLATPQRYIDWIAIFNRARRLALYTPEFQEQLTAVPEDFFLEIYSRFASRDIVSAISLADLFSYLPCDLLVKVDIAAMAHSLETRPPFLDHEFVEFAGRLSGRLKLRGRKGKHVLIAAFRDLIPPPIQKRGKMGFGVPLDHWFRGPLSELTRHILLDPRTLARGYFRREALEQLLSEHNNGLWNHSHRIWALLFFELWQRKWTDGEDVADLKRCLASVV